MVIVESNKEWDKFIREFKKHDSVVLPIQCDVNKHPVDTKLCLLYIRLLDDDTKEMVSQKNLDNEKILKWKDIIN